MSKKNKQPMQPVIVDKNGVARFKKNEVVRMLLDLASPKGVDMNTLVVAGDGLPQKDWEQFYQLIGYSLSGYAELSRVSSKSYCKAEAKASKAKSERNTTP